MQYFWGIDTYAARGAIDEAARRLAARLQWVDHTHLAASSLADLVGQGGGLFGQTLVVVRDPSALPKEVQESIAAYATARPAGAAACILWERGMPDKRSKLWRAVKPIAQEFPAPRPAEAAGWLVKRARELGGEVLPAAAERLTARLGTDRWRLEHELQRLLLIASPVTPELVERESAAAEPAEIFATLEALARGDRREAVRSVEALLGAGQSEFYILSMIAYQFRTLLIVRGGIDQRQRSEEIARLGKLHPYVVEKSLALAKQKPAAHWRDGLTRILATDFAIKQGTVDPRTGLLMLVLTLLTR